MGLIEAMENTKNRSNQPTKERGVIMRTEKFLKERFKDQQPFSFDYTNKAGVTKTHLVSQNSQISSLNKKILTVLHGTKAYHYLLSNIRNLQLENKPLAISTPEKMPSPKQISELVNYLAEILNKKIANYHSGENKSEGMLTVQQQLLAILQSKEWRKARNNLLFNYLNNVPSKKVKEEKELLIFPYDSNQSQKAAIKNAMEYDISVIQGPPGTGKTQTILNIIANAVVRKQSVLVVSNNNSAIDNVLEKLAKEDTLLPFYLRLGNGSDYLTPCW